MTATIDITTRFPRVSLAEARAKAREQERWVFPDLISSSVTMIYGKSNVGKSYLVASMVLSLMVEDREFMGMQPTDRNKVWRPVILYTDPGSDREYAERIGLGIPDDADADVPMYYIGVTRDPQEWRALAEHLASSGYNFVILDNLLGATGDTNEPAAIATVFDGLTLLVHKGIPCVVLHHESEWSTSKRGAPPMGNSISTQKARAWIQVRQTGRRKLRGGNMGLYVQSNKLEQHHEIIAKPLAGPNYEVIQKGPVDDDDAKAERPDRKRHQDTRDRNGDIVSRMVDGDWQGVQQRDLTARIAAEYGGTADSWKTNITQGALSGMVHNTGGRGAATSWERKPSG